MKFLWDNNTAAQATGGQSHGQWQASRVVIDSRIVQAGDLFVAIKGDNFDGHDFVKDALSKGAVAAVVSRVPAGLENAPRVLVDDAMAALEGLGRFARARSKARIVGVTGSVGKTSTKEMLRMALSAHGETYATAGNLNNHIGTPLNLANLPPETPFAVFEMGMNHAGEISHLVQMVRPHVAAITNIEAVHMEFFDSIEHIADAKCEIFEALEPNGTAILNRDSPQFAHMEKRAHGYGVKHISTFGAHEKADCRLIDYKPAAKGCAVSADIFGKHQTYTMHAVGRHWATTSLLALAATQALGLDTATTLSALAKFGELDGRGRIIHLQVAGGEALLIDDSYNASPAAMRAAFAKTAEVWEGNGRKGRRIAALGNMLELGPDGPWLHSELSPDLEKAGFDAVFTAGELMKHLHDSLPPRLRALHVSQSLDLLPLLQKELKPGDVLLVKGSHGSKMYQLAAQLMKMAEAPGEKKHAV